MPSCRNCTLVLFVTFPTILAQLLSIRIAIQLWIIERPLLACFWWRWFNRTLSYSYILSCASWLSITKSKLFLHTHYRLVNILKYICACIQGAVPMPRACLIPPTTKTSCSMKLQQTDVLPWETFTPTSTPSPPPGSANTNKHISLTMHQSLKRSLYTFVNFISHDKCFSTGRHQDSFQISSVDTVLRARATYKNFLPYLAVFIYALLIGFPNTKFTMAKKISIL